MKIEHIFINNLKLYTGCYYISRSRAIKKVQSTCFNHVKSFSKKRKRDLELLSIPHFLHDFSRYVLLTDQISLSDSFNILRCWRMCIAIVCFPGCDVINLEINLSFFIRPLSHKTKKIRLKI